MYVSMYFDKTGFFKNDMQARDIGRKGKRDRKRE